MKKSFCILIFISFLFITAMMMGTIQVSASNIDMNTVVSAAKNMCTVSWTAPCTFHTWMSGKGVYNNVTATDGTSGDSFMKGKTYIGIPYTMNTNKSYNSFPSNRLNDSDWLSYVKSHSDSSSYQGYENYYGHTNVCIIGVDCSGLVQRAYNAAGVSWSGLSTSNISGRTDVVADSGFWNDLHPGDILSKSGHMMLVYSVSGSTVYVYEATPPKARSSSYTITYLKNQGYVPYRYKNAGAVSSHAVDSAYPRDFSATAKYHIDVFNADHSDAGNRYIDEGDHCTIHEVYIDGCCKVTYPSSASGTATYYAHINDFNFSVGDKPADLGTGFIGLILIDIEPQWKPITADSDSRVRVREEIGHAKQLWRFERQSDGSYVIRSAVNGTVLDAHDFGTANGTAVEVCGENGSDAQKWYFYSNGDGSYYVRPKYCNLVLDMNTGVYSDGEVVQLWEKNGTIAQKWCVYHQDDVQLQAPKLTVNAANSAGKTVFTWNEIYGENQYAVKIWKNKLWEGDSYHTEWWASSGYGIQLPAGTYQAYVDACNYFDTKMSNTVTFTVNAATYSVSFNANGGTGAPSSQTKTYGSNLTLSSTKPTRTGYTFNNWSGSDGKTYAPGGTYTGNANLTLTAQWTANTYFIDINGFLDGGYVSNINDFGTVDVYINGKLAADDVTDYYQSFVIGTKYEIKDVKAASGKVYSGVKSGSISGTIGTSDVLIQLEFKTVSHIDLNGFLDGSYASNINAFGTADVYIDGKLVADDVSDYYQSFAFGTKYEIKDIKAANGKVYSGVKSGSVSGVIGTSDVLIQLEFKTVSTITFNANGGTGAPSSQTKTYGSNLTLSSTKPTRTGYTFNNWSGSDGKTYAPGGTYTGNANLTLTAQWKANTYPVSYNANGGTGAPSSQTKTYGSNLTLSSTKPTRTGYTFNNWSGSDGNTYAPGGTYTGNANLTLTAQWTANTYTVSYNANGGTGAPSSQTKTHGVGLTLSSVKPTRTGYTFQGWASAAAGAAAYTAGAAYTADSSITLYAVWKANTYSVDLWNMSPTTAGTTTVTATYGSVLPSITVPVKNDYIFDGYYDQMDGKGNRYYSSDGTGIRNWEKTASTTLYANWLPGEDDLRFIFEKNTDGENTYSVIQDSEEEYQGEIVIPSVTPNGGMVTRIGDWGFESCSGITSITVPESVTFIGHGAFYDCTSLTGISLPDSATEIGNSVFGCCTSLRSISLPDGVTQIGDCAFCSCTSLMNVMLPDSITTIGWRAFYGCSSLTSITLPASVTTIHEEAFIDCSKLKSVHFTGNALTSMNADAFDGTAPDFTIYGSKDVFGWLVPRWNGYNIVIVDAILGDISCDDSVDVLDVVLLLQNSMFPDICPISYAGNTDFNGDGSIDVLDAAMLLQYSIFPELYPIA